MSVSTTFFHRKINAIKPKIPIFFEMTGLITANILRLQKSVGFSIALPSG